MLSFGTTIDDLVDERRPDLQHYEVGETPFVDAVSPTAVAALGLPPTYPASIPHPPCQAIAEAAYAQGEHGIVPLSAASGTRAAEEELVIFDRDVAALTKKTSRVKFDSWY